MAKLDLTDLVKRSVDKALQSYEFDMGITLKEAVKKQIPTVPAERENSFGDKTLVCPSCGNPIMNVWSKAEYKPKYCHYCGQKFEWERVKTDE